MFAMFFANWVTRNVYLAACRQRRRERNRRGRGRIGRVLCKVGTQPILEDLSTHFQVNIMGAGKLKHRQVGEFSGAPLRLRLYESLPSRVASPCISKKTTYRYLGQCELAQSQKIELGSLIPLYLPPYRPDLNPIEQLWRVLKNRFFVGFVPRNYDELLERACEAIHFFQSHPKMTKRICSPKKQFKDVDPAWQKNNPILSKLQHIMLD